MTQKLFITKLDWDTIHYLLEDGDEGVSPIIDLLSRPCAYSTECYDCGLTHKIQYYDSNLRPTSIETIKPFTLANGQDLALHEHCVVLKQKDSDLYLDWEFGNSDVDVIIFRRQSFAREFASMLKEKGLDYDICRCLPNQTITS